MFFVYVLQSEKNGKFYVGQTADVNERLIRHNAGRAPSTKGGRPWKLVHVEQFPSREGAMARERELKSGHSHSQLTSLIQQAKPG